jgi:hypothetical protein
MRRRPPSGPDGSEPSRWVGRTITFSSTRPCWAATPVWWSFGSECGRSSPSGPPPPWPRPSSWPAGPGSRWWPGRQRRSCGRARPCSGWASATAASPPSTRARSPTRTRRWRPWSFPGPGGGRPGSLLRHCSVTGWAILRRWSAPCTSSALPGSTSKQTGRCAWRSMASRTASIRPSVCAWSPGHSGWWRGLIYGESLANRRAPARAWSARCWNAGSASTQRPRKRA